MPAPHHRAERGAQYLAKHCVLAAGICRLEDVNGEAAQSCRALHLQIQPLHCRDAPHDAAITVEAGHDIAVVARQRVLQRHRVLNLMTHVDPWRRPDLDHAAGAPQQS